jgi:putative transposase
MEVADVVRLKELEADKGRMQRIIAKLTLKVDAMDELVRKTAGAFAATRSGEALATSRIESARSVARSCAPDAVHPKKGLPSVSVVCTLEQAAHEHGYPHCVRVDNGPAFIASALETWANDHGVELLFIQSGKPTQNAFIESFNSRVRDELLMNRFRTIFEARVAAEDWRNEYNGKHSHSSLGGMTPEEFLARHENY